MEFDIYFSFRKYFEEILSFIKTGQESRLLYMNTYVYI